MSYSMFPPWEANAKRALELTQDLIDREASNSVAWYTQGFALYRLGRLDEAEQAIERATTIGVRRRLPHLVLAVIYHQRGD